MVNLTKFSILNKDKLIEKLEKDISKSGISIDKALDAKIERQISHLGKEMIITNIVARLSKRLQSSKNDILKNKILLLLIKLYKYNRQVHDSLKRELTNDRKLLNKRIKAKIHSNNVHMEIYNKLWKIANEHLSVFGNHARNHSPDIRYHPYYVIKMIYHKNKAEKIYKALSSKNVRKTIHKILLTKLDKVYNALLLLSSELSKHIISSINCIKVNRNGDLVLHTHQMEGLIDSKIRVLRNFAFKYSYNLIHSQEFFDSKNNRIILATKNL